MAPTPSSRKSSTASNHSEPITLHHRGFDLTIRAMQGRYGAQSYGYAAFHRGHVLHESAGEFGSASAADKAGRRLIDDALNVFDSSMAHEEEGV